MKKLLIMLAIFGASQAVLVDAAACDLETNKIGLKNDTDRMLYVGVYKLDKNGNAVRCFNVTPDYSMNPGFRIPERESGPREIPVPKSDGKIYFSSSKLEENLSKKDIDSLEAKGFKGFKVKIGLFSDNNYKISQDKTGKKFTGDSE